MFLLLVVCATTSFGGPSYQIGGHVPSLQARQARHIGRHARGTKMQLAVAIKPRDPEGLADLLQRIYDPNDPQYRQFLTPEQFRERFAPSDKDVRDMVQYLASRGLNVTRVHGNNLVVNAEGDTATVEKAFQVQIQDYQASDGRNVHGPDRDPLVQSEVGSRLSAVVGLSNFADHRPRRLHKLARLDPRAFGTHAAISSYMTPAKIKSAYNLNGVAQTGAGQTLALFQLDGYNMSDITTWVNYFGLTAPTLTNVLVDGYSGAAGANTDEVVMDIELMIALAPGVSAIRVYEGPNTDAGVLDTYSRIATDNIAKSVSSSWGAPENQSTNSFLNAENSIFQQMAAQGQSIFVASGDNGAYDDSSQPSTLNVDDPASQPYVTSVGGTTLTLNGANGYLSESSWGTSANGLGGGGGISRHWSIPTWQNGLASTANRGSTTMRMVPDVALDANPSTGYPIYTQGAWYAIGGTSAAAPLWAAFMALVNQARVANGLSTLGFANPSIYQIGQSSLYSSSFHDIADSSTNLYYPATTSYDLSTGWGSFNGAGLLAALSSATLPPMPPTNFALASGAGNITVSWTVSAGATSYTVYRATSGSGPFVSVSSGAANAYVDTVAAGTYYYYVIAVNAAGNSGPTSTLSAAPNVTPPAAPTNLSATVVP